MRRQFTAVLIMVITALLAPAAYSQAPSPASRPDLVFVHFEDSVALKIGVAADVGTAKWIQCMNGFVRSDTLFVNNVGPTGKQLCPQPFVGSLHRVDPGVCASPNDLMREVKRLIDEWERSFEWIRVIMCGSKSTHVVGNKKNSGPAPSRSVSRT